MPLIITKGLGIEEGVVALLVQSATGGIRQVALTFSSNVSLDPVAAAAASWSIVSVHGVQVPVTGVIGTGNVVTLTTGSQISGETYTVFIPIGIADEATGNPMVAPYSINFTGVAPVPAVVMVRSVDATLLEVIFSTAVNPGDALSPGNYSISPSLTVLSVSRISPIIFRLLTSRQLVGSSYNLSISGIRPDS